MGNKEKIEELEAENELIKQRLETLESGQHGSNNGSGNTIIVGEPSIGDEVEEVEEVEVVEENTEEVVEDESEVADEEIIIEENTEEVEGSADEEDVEDVEEVVIE